MSGPRETPGALADEAQDSAYACIDALHRSLDAMRQRGDGQSPAARAISIAITHSETALLWIRCAMLGGEP
jgi:hypothetical protein